MILSLYSCAIVHSVATKNLVPTCTPTAPSINAAAICLPSAIPPAAITGIFTASTTWGTSAIVVRSPTWPPDSPPSAITANAPNFSIFLARATLGTTGITLIPASSHLCIYLPGLPAPVVITFMPSSITTWTASSTNGLISIIFTPKGLSVSSLHFLISARSCSPFEFIAAIRPRPPAFETPAAREASATQAIPPWKIGNSRPSDLSITVEIICTFSFFVFLRLLCVFEHNAKQHLFIIAVLHYCLNTTANYINCQYT